MSVNGSPLSATQTRYCTAAESVAFQLNVTGFDACAPPIGEVSVAALCVSQLAAAETVKRRCAEKVESQPLVNNVSTYHSAAPLGSCSCCEVLETLARAARIGELPLTEIQSRYPLAPVTLFHDSVTGEVTVAPSAGELRVVVAPQVVCVPLVNVDFAETTSGHAANVVTTHHVTVPSGTNVFSEVEVVAPARSPESFGSAIKSL